MSGLPFSDLILTASPLTSSTRASGALSPTAGSATAMWEPSVKRRVKAAAIAALRGLRFMERYLIKGAPARRSRFTAARQERAAVTARALSRKGSQGFKLKSHPWLGVDFSD